MKIIRKQKGKRKPSFKRFGTVFYKDDWEKQDRTRVLCFTWNSFNYLTFKEYLAQILHTRKEQDKKNLPICIIGDAKFPPI
jgi:hypothetical protein